MILRILALAWLLGAASAGHTEDPPPEPPEPPEPEVCLTGQMRDVQSWTDEQGTIIADTDDTDHAAMDLSSSLGPATILERFITTMVVGKNGRQKSFGYLSMARCNLTSVPQVFDLQDYQQRPLYQTLQYVTFFGNRFSDNSLEGQLYDADLNATGATETSFSDSKFVKQDRPTWDVGFRKIKFPYLLELDLRSCNIQHLHDGIFEGMPALTSLYLANNNIIYVTSHAFLQLTNLVHLDLSHNMASEKIRNRMPVLWQSDNIFSHLPNFTSLDLSLTRLSPSSVTLFRSLGRSFKRLSLCYTGLEYLTADNFKGTNLKLLDVSGNVGILDEPKALNGLQHTLEVLYADSVGLKTLKNLAHFEELKILKASNNEISLIERDLPTTWKSLQILDLDHNRLSSWAGKLYSLMENLDVLSLRYNSINVVKAPMIQDFQNVSFLGVSGNFFVCTCYNRELFEIAANNDKKQGLSNIIIRNSYNVTEHHVGFHEYYSKIARRNTVERNCDESNKSCRPDINDDINGEFHLFDYNPFFYNCFVIDDGVTMGFSEVHPCNMSRSDNIDDEYIRGSWTKIVIIGVVATVALPLLILGFLFRRSFSYFYITVKNSAMLSLMADSKCYEDGSIFNYDVFVSYCNEDRPWVLDQLLPHVEKDCNVSVCLHERDFQVGLSILENIVSCMDRSRSIMLVISQRFLLSQWCQFEMHLAQHRLLETRREDLILILLEDIPRRMRPNILHYLMVTKTYVLWPKEDTSEQALFWRRVKKSIYTQKMKHADNVSLA